MKMSQRTFNVAVRYVGSQICNEGCFLNDPLNSSAYLPLALLCLFLHTLKLK